jgi:hypothetical protein
LAFPGQPKTEKIGKNSGHPLTLSKVDVGSACETLGIKIKMLIWRI